MHDMLSKLMEESDRLLDSFEEIKRITREYDKHLYERWKAGGFLIDDNVVSMYPTVRDVVDNLFNRLEDTTDD